MVKKRVAIRADGSESMGLGHVQRSLALAQYFMAEGCEILFITNTAVLNCLPKTAFTNIQVIVAENVSLDIEAETIIEIIHAEQVGLLVIDGYHFTEGFLHRIKKHTLAKILMLDDLEREDLTQADFILNQNIDSSNAYPKKSQCFLGPKYALLKLRFYEYQKQRHYLITDPLKILVTLGGTDPFDLSMRVLKALQNCTRKIEVTLLLSKKSAALSKLLQQLSYPVERIEFTNDMATLMANVDVAITAAGSTCWELVYMSVPFFAIVQAENQKVVKDAILKHCVGTILGQHTDLFEESITNSIECFDNELARIVKENQTKLGVASKTQEMIQQIARHI